MSTPTTRTLRPSQEPPLQTPPFLQTTEMVAEVMDYLTGDDLRACMGVSRVFRAGALRRVYRHVSLPSAGASPNRGVMEHCTTAVELRHHNHKRCSDGKPVAFKHLRTLILNRDVVEDHPGQGPAKGNYGIPLDFGRYACEEPNCVSRDLAPQRVVVRPFSSPAKDRSIFFVPPTSCETIVHLRRQGPYQYRRDVTESATPREVTIVLLPSFYGQFKSFMAASESETGSKSQDNDSLIRACLAPYLLTNPQNKVTIVGLEDANPFASQLHWSERQMRGAEEEMLFRGYLNRLMAGTQLRPDGTRGKVWDDAARKQRQSTIRVRTTREYFESNAWGEELSHQIVGLWLSAYYAREEEDKELEGLRTQASTIISSRSASISFPTRSTTRGRSCLSLSYSPPTTRSIMADIALKTRTLLAPGAINRDGCAA